MKQFNLDEYLKDTTQKVVTRDGRSVRIVCTDFLKRGHPVLALVSHGVEELAYSVSTDGKFSLDNIDDLDLFFADKEPSYRPYKNAEECFADVKKHGGWVKDKYAIRHISQITFKEPQGIMSDLVQIRGCNGRTYNELLMEFVWVDDGTPCGVKEE